MEGSLAIELEISTMHIWARRLWVSDENATFDLHISDWNGRSLGGAAVDIRYGYSRASDDWGSTKYESVQATADANGIARVDMAFDDIRDTEYDVMVEGTVTSGETEQRLASRLFVRDPPAWSWELDEYGLDVNDYDNKLDFDKVETWTGTAYMDGEPLASSWVHCYLATDHHVMARENVTTDGEGYFSFQFETPEKGLDPGDVGDSFYFSPAKEGEENAYEMAEGGLVLGVRKYPLTRQENLDEYLEKYLSEALSLVSEGPGSGLTLKISMEHPDVGPGWMSRVYMGFDTDHWDERVPEWTYWTKNPVSSSSIKYGGGLLYDNCWSVDGVWRTEVVLPENVLSEDFFLWIELTDPWIPDKSLSVYMEKDGMGQDDGQRTDESWWRNAAVLVLIVVAVAAAVIIILRSGRRKDSVRS
jgi:hypothetical protein